MKVVRTVRAMQRLSDELRQRGRVGFVPTMGALHEGHLRLVGLARRRSDCVVVSVFVNPLQFGPREDYRRYPRTFPTDRRLLAAVGADVVFFPTVRGMYPAGFASAVRVERLTEHLCGAARPGHFQGVTTVVAKLLNIVKPHLVVFGQKDAQQAQVIRQMARDLNFGVDIVVAPTVREPDGLAMSSRNRYLSPRERAQAVVLYRALGLGRALVLAGERNPTRVIAVMQRLIETQSESRIDYIEVVDTAELAPVRSVRGEVLIALAVRFGRTRLIDNLVIRAGRV